MAPLGDYGQVEAHFGPFEDSANLDGTICVERTIGSQIILDTPDGSPN